MPKKVCFSFWLDEKDAEKLREKLDKASANAHRRISIGEVVWPAIKSFMGGKHG